MGIWGADGWRKRKTSKKYDKTMGRISIITHKFVKSKLFSTVLQKVKLFVIDYVFGSRK